MGGGGIFQKTNTQGLGAGVIPSAATLNSRDYLISQGRGASWANPNARSVNPHGSYLDAGVGRSMGDGLGYWTNPKGTHLISGAGGYPGASDKPSYGGTRTPSTQYTADEIAALKLEYDTDEALRQDKLDKMSQLAQGQGGSGGGVSGQIVGDGGDLNIQHIPMERSKDGFPTLADFEQPLHPFMGKRKLNLKGYA
jgi:hypothetical protein